jgi:hypothetical protein
MIEIPISPKVAPPAVSLTVKCRMCGQNIALHEDSEETRALGTDPRQQLRMHLWREHRYDLIRFTRSMAWLIDMLAFDAVDDPKRWRNNIGILVDYYLGQEIR